MCCLVHARPTVQVGAGVSRGWAAIPSLSQVMASAARGPEPTRDDMECAGRAAAMLGLIGQWERQRRNLSRSPRRGQAAAAGGAVSPVPHTLPMLGPDELERRFATRFMRAPMPMTMLSEPLPLLDAHDVLTPATATLLEIHAKCAFPKECPTHTRLLRALHLSFPEYKTLGVHCVGGLLGFPHVEWGGAVWSSRPPACEAQFLALHGLCACHQWPAWWLFLPTETWIGPQYLHPAVRTGDHRAASIPR